MIQNVGGKRIISNQRVWGLMAAIMNIKMRMGIIKLLWNIRLIPEQKFLMLMQVKQKLVQTQKHMILKRIGIRK